MSMPAASMSFSRASPVSSSFFTTCGGVARIEPGEQRVQLRIGIMLFERDDRNVRLLQHGGLPVGGPHLYGIALMPASSARTCAISSAFTVWPMPG